MPEGRKLQRLGLEYRSEELGFLSAGNVGTTESFQILMKVKSDISELYFRKMYLPSKM